MTDVTQDNGNTDKHATTTQTPTHTQTAAPYAAYFTTPHFTVLQVLKRQFPFSTSV